MFRNADVLNLYKLISVLKMSAILNIEIRYYLLVENSRLSKSM